VTINIAKVSLFIYLVRKLCLDNVTMFIYDLET